MGFRKYIIKHREYDNWLTGIHMDGGEKVYQYLSDIGMALIYETRTEAERVARACRSGKVQVLHYAKDGKPYGEDVEDGDGNHNAGGAAGVPGNDADAHKTRKRRNARKNTAGRTGRSVL